MKEEIINYLIRAGDATSQWVNVVFLGSKNPNESISGRAWRMQNRSTFWKYARPFIDTVIFWEDDHCELSYIADVRRAQTLIANRTVL